VCFISSYTVVSNRDAKFRFSIIEIWSFKNRDTKFQESHDSFPVFRRTDAHATNICVYEHFIVNFTPAPPLCLTNHSFHDATNAQTVVPLLPIPTGHIIRKTAILCPSQRHHHHHLETSLVYRSLVPTNPCFTKTRFCHHETLPWQQDKH
jgi:hypothetical protein